LNLLNGCAIALAVFLTEFLSDAALLDTREDLVDKVSAGHTIPKAKWYEQLAYLWAPIYTLLEPFCNILIFISNVRVLNSTLVQWHEQLGARNWHENSIEQE
jgi:hypothetical protein